jgi:hypothetical protein
MSGIHAYGTGGTNFEVQKRKTLASFRTKAEPAEKLRYGEGAGVFVLTMTGIYARRAKVTLFNTHRLKSRSKIFEVVWPEQIVLGRTGPLVLLLRHRSAQVISRSSL